MMLPGTSRAPFISFEGCEGCGKTTQIKLLLEALSAKGLPVFAVREPGGHPTSEAIRTILISNEYNVVPRAELLMFMASRQMVFSNVIKPKLEQGQIVICDRFIDSSVVYQGYGRALGRDWVIVLNGLVTDDILPDLTILLDIEPAIGLARQSNPNRFEEEALEFHQKVRQGYLQEARLNQKRIVTLDANRSIQEVQQEIAGIVSERFQLGVP